VVDIVPFRGLLYNQEKTGPLDRVTAPPYDVIKPQQQEELYERSPYNVVRLILGKEYPGDSETNNRYTRSAQVFAAWRQDKTLIQDAEPGFYVYRQDYTFAGRTLSRLGFFARVRLEDFSRGNICPHEFTLSKAKADRARLLRACRANFSPIFGLYSDPSKNIDPLLQSATAGEPLATIDDGNVVHRFWRFSDDGAAEKISAFFADRRIYIADGHHRYETALAYHEETGDPGSAHVMMFLTNLDSDSMSIFPIHRLIRTPAPFDKNDFLTRVTGYCEVEPVSGLVDRAAVEAALGRLRQGGIGFIAYLGNGEGCLLRVLSPDNILPLLDRDEPEDLKVLDVAQLHVGVLRGLLGIDTRKSDQQPQVAYKVDAAEGLSGVDRGEWDLAFFMNATRIDQVRRLAEKGIRLPQKATFFYPKLLSGLVINPFVS